MSKQNLKTQGEQKATQREKETVEKIAEQTTEQVKAARNDSDLDFQQVETNDFEIHNFDERELKATFVGETIDHPLTDDDGNKKPMLEFRSYPDKQRILVNYSYKLVAFFVNRESATEIDYSKNPVFIVRKTGEKKVSGTNRTVTLFSIHFAYPKQ